MKTQITFYPETPYNKIFQNSQINFKPKAIVAVQAIRRTQEHVNNVHMACPKAVYKLVKTKKQSHPFCRPDLQATTCLVTVVSPPKVSPKGGAEKQVVVGV